MEYADYSIKLDTHTLDKAEKIFAAFGMNLNEAIRLFLNRSIMAKGLPFDADMEKPNAILLSSFAEADEMLADPSIKGYATIEELNAAMDADDESEGEYV